MIPLVNHDSRARENSGVITIYPNTIHDVYILDMAHSSLTRKPRGVPCQPAQVPQCVKQRSNRRCDPEPKPGDPWIEWLGLDFLPWNILNQLVGGWPTALKNDGVRQLGWWHSQLNGQIKFMFQTTNQINFCRVSLKASGAKYGHNFRGAGHRSIINPLRPSLSKYVVGCILIILEGSWAAKDWKM